MSPSLHAVFRFLDEPKLIFKQLLTSFLLWSFSLSSVWTQIFLSSLRSFSRQAGNGNQNDWEWMWSGEMIFQGFDLQIE
jgi:hypothetical protein